MDLTNINTPEHVVGKSLKPIMKNVNASVRESALTRWRKGYSIKTKRYRLTKWGRNGELGYELYDHKNDKNELINLASNEDYSEVMDSLKVAIEQRIADASIKPKGLGRQFENAKPMFKAKNITFGDTHNLNGEIKYFKEKIFNVLVRASYLQAKRRDGERSEAGYPSNEAAAWRVGRDM